MLAFAAQAGSDEALVVLLSGGASALLTAPLAGLELVELRATTLLLLESGAEIGELNCVRKHLTAVSGGRLAAATRASRVLVLAISDVLGDDLGTDRLGTVRARRHDATPTPSRCSSGASFSSGFRPPCAPTSSRARAASGPSR